MKTTTIRKYKLQTGLTVSALCLMAGGLILFSPSAARAASGAWATAVNGDWSDGTKWTGGIVADGSGSSATFPSLGPTPTVITLDSSRTIGSIAFTPNGKIYRLDPLVGTEVLTLAGGSPALVRAVSGGRLFINVPLAGAVGIRSPNQTGRVILGATNTFTGDIEIHRGTIQVGVIDAIPHGSGKGNVVLVYNVGIGGNGEAAGLDISTNDITINALNSYNAVPASPAGFTNYPVVNTSSTVAGVTTLTVGDNNANGNFAGTIGDEPGSGARQVALTKTGNGKQVLRLGENADTSTTFYTYTGPTTVNAGTLQIDGPIYGGAGAAAITVNAGAVGGKGSTFGAVTVLATGRLGAGACADIFTIYGGLDMSAPNTTYDWELAANSTATPGTDFDQIVLAGGSSDVTDANLNIQFTSSATAPDGTGFWASDHSWLIVSGAVTGNFKNIQNGTNAFGSFYTTVSGSGVTLNFKNAGPVSPKAKITSIVPNSPINPTSVVVNYNNCVVGKTYFLQWKSPVTGGYTTVGSGKVAAGATDSQTDATASGTQRYYRVYYVGP